MNGIETKMDKSEWGAGPWQDEPDRVEFEHMGFPCLIVRVPNSGHLCGYVAVPPGHPWHGQRDPDNAHVHGGITYAEPCQGAVCHVPKPGEPDNVWWLGFDHHHTDDMAPFTVAILAKVGYHDPMYGRGTYRTIAYARAGCENLARQAAAEVAR